MAFQFVPNADGSFTEGDKQTNPESGIEYMYHDGAWRPLGPDLNDAIADFDERYVKTEGNSDFKGDLYMKPPTSGVSRFRVLEGNTPHTFEITSHPKIGGQLTDSKIHIRIKNQKDADDNDKPETIIRWVPDPTQPDHAVNKAYVDNNALTGDFLPLSGGDLTGPLRINDSGAALTFKKDSLDNQFQINPNGNSSDYWTNIYGYNSGGMRFRVTKDNTTNTYGTCISVGVEDLTVGGSTHPWTTQVNFLRTPTNPHHAANKQYVDDRASTVLHGSSLPSGGLETGQLFYNTSTRQLFIGD